MSGLGVELIRRAGVHRLTVADDGLVQRAVANESRSAGTVQRRPVVFQRFAVVTAGCDVDLGLREPEHTPAGHAGSIEMLRPKVQSGFSHSGPASHSPGSSGRPQTGQGSPPSGVGSSLMVPHSTPTETLRAALRALHLSTRQLALVSGVCHTVIWRYLRGHSIGSASHDRLSALVERRRALTNLVPAVTNLVVPALVERRGG